MIIAGSVNNEQAKEIFGEWEEPEPYIRIVPQPISARRPAVAPLATRARRPAGRLV